jgi:hypothetical protein
MDVLIGGDAVRIMLAGEGLDKYGIGVCMEGNHDVLVPTACPWVEAASVIREDLVNRDGEDVNGLLW